MKIQIIEKECVAKVGLSVEFSNSECASIEKVADKLDSEIYAVVKRATKQQEASDTIVPLKAEELFVHIDLETAMRINWLLGNFTRSKDSDLFNTADNLCLTTMAEINHEENELNTQLTQ